MALYFAKVKLISNLIKVERMKDDEIVIAHWTALLRYFMEEGRRK
jgi:hypothetical protein